MGGVLRLPTLLTSLLAATLIASGTLAAHDKASAGTSASDIANFVAGSTRLVCALTGHQETTTYKVGLVAADRGYSFMYQGKVWWLFGDTDPLPSNLLDGGPNVVDRYPGSGATGLEEKDNDSMAWSQVTSPAAPPAVPVAPPVPCPIPLVFPSGGAPVAGYYANPSVEPDPPSASAIDSQVSLREGESAVSGITVAGKMYVTFDTDNPVSAVPPLAPNCAPTKTKSICLGHSTRSVMAVLLNKSTLRFRGLYDLSAPTAQYGNGAKFVETALEADNGFVYIWGTEGGVDTLASAVYLARIKSTDIGLAGPNFRPKEIEYYVDSTPNGIPVWAANNESMAGPIFSDSPNLCAAQLGVQWNPILNLWVMLYNCVEPVDPTGGIFMRTSPAPWGPWSEPQTIFNAKPLKAAETGFCYFIYSTVEGKPYPCASGTPDPPGMGIHGAAYGPYFVADWTWGTPATTGAPASTTIYYTIDTDNPYGQVIMESTIVGTAIKKPVVPPCKGTSCM